MSALRLNKGEQGSKDTQSVKGWGGNLNSGPAQGPGKIVSWLLLREPLGLQGLGLDNCEASVTALVPREPPPTPAPQL